MRQYCRYCVHCIEGDVFFCTDDERTMSEAEIKRANNCPNFMLTEDIISGKPYNPRRKYDRKTEPEEINQLSLWEENEND